MLPWRSPPTAMPGASAQTGAAEEGQHLSQPGESTAALTSSSSAADDLTGPAAGAADGSRKRKADSEESPGVAKRQLLGLNFFTSVLMVSTCALTQLTALARAVTRQLTPACYAVPAAGPVAAAETAVALFPEAAKVLRRRRTTGAAQPYGNSVHSRGRCHAPDDRVGGGDADGGDTSARATRPGLRPR
jgi:hypothetical protein